jgi:hypothetical protein
MEAAMDNPPGNPAPPAGGPELDTHYILWAYIAVGIAIVVAVILTVLIHAPALVTATGFTSFSVIYIVAQAIERFLQPISELVGKPDETKAAQKALVAAVEAPGAVPAVTKDTADYRKLERATYFWAAASCISLIVCAFLGLGLLQTVVEFSNKTVPGWFEAFDVVITGLAIGAGTKPLHDLIDSIQKSKEAKAVGVGG